MSSKSDIDASICICKYFENIGDFFMYVCTYQVVLYTVQYEKVD